MICSLQRSLFSDDGWGQASMLHTSIHAQRVRSTEGAGLEIAANGNVRLAAVTTNKNGAVVNSSVDLGGERELYTIDDSTCYTVCFRSGRRVRVQPRRQVHLRRRRNAS